MKRGERRLVKQGGVVLLVKDSGIPEDRLDEALKRLTFREREVIKLRYGTDDGYEYALEEVGRIFDCTKETVRQIQKRALAKLQQIARGEKLKWEQQRDARAEEQRLWEKATEFRQMRSRVARYIERGMRPMEEIDDLLKTIHRFIDGDKKD